MSFSDVNFSNFSFYFDINLKKYAAKAFKSYKKLKYLNSFRGYSEEYS